MPKHSNLAIALRGKPIELNDATFADKRLVAMP